MLDALKKPVTEIFKGATSGAPTAESAAPAHPLASVAPTGGGSPAQAAHPFAGMFDAAKPAPATGGVAAPAAAHPAAPAHFTPTDPTAKSVYADNEKRQANMHLNLNKSQQGDMKSFEANYEKHKAEYEKVAAKEDMPPELIAALHWRESSGNFHTYLAQGDPLGKKAVHVPTNEPVRSDWTLAAEDALSSHSGNQKKVGLHQDTTDLAAMASYAEMYNGLGYHNKGRTSPYVWSGTDQYKSGKYVRDGVYDPQAKDQQLGVMSMVQDLEQKEHPAKK